LANTEDQEGLTAGKTSNPSSKSEAQKGLPEGENITMNPETWNNPEMEIDNNSLH